MRESLKTQWKTVPAYIRKPVIFVAGMVFVIAAGLTGWLPGPGGIPLFLVGIAILSTEFSWARKVKDFVMNIVRACSRWYRRHPVLGIVLLTLCAIATIVLVSFMIRSAFQK